MAYDLSFGQWIIQRRKELRLQRTQLAALLSCATITLRKIEADERRPSQQLAELLAEHLGLDLQDRISFVRVARGELTADRLPALPLRPAQEKPSVLTPQLPVRAAIRTNLPAPLTSFVGRGQDLETIPALLRTQRLVTLTGVGGVGKTRLAAEVGIHMLQTHQVDIARDGIWLVALAPLNQPALVAHAIARLLHLPEQPGRTALELLQEHLADKQMLLILDNCEHLVQICAELAEQLLLHCWQLRILATSREPLRVPGEVLAPVLPLTLPSAHEQRLTHILATSAAQLFIARMHAGRSTGIATEQFDHIQAATIGEICRRLDGIPLALELAAPLTQSMSLAEIANQLQHQMAILTNTYRTAIPRHQTMHSALIWSYRLLAPEEQRFLAYMAVFAGGWTLDAAQALCPDRSAERILPALQQLVAKSLVLVEGQGNQQRYRLLEPVRQFAQAQLEASGEREQARELHAHYFYNLATQMGQARDTPRERDWLDRLEPERANLRAVNSWAIEQGQSEFVHSFNGMLFAFWLYRSNSDEARHCLEGALALTAPPANRSALLAEALALDVAGYIASEQRHYDQALRWFEREHMIQTMLDNQPGIATSLRGCGFVSMHRADLVQAQLYTEQSLQVSRAAYDRWGAAWSLYDLGYLTMVRGEYIAAQELLTEALSELRDQGIAFGTFRAFIALGHTMRFTGNTAAAIEYYYASLRIQQQMQYIQVTNEALESLAGIATHQGAALQAAPLFGATYAHSQSSALQRWEHLDAIYERDLAATRSLLTAEQWAAAWQQGVAMSLDQAVAYALDML